MNGSGTKEVSPQISPPIDDPSSDDEAETDAILASLLTQLDNLGRQQHETVTFVHDQLQKQRQAVDILRKSVRKAETVIHQKRFSRQRAKIKRLQKLAAAGTPSHSHSVTPVASAVKQLEPPQERNPTLTEKKDTNGKVKGTPSVNKVFTGTPFLATGSTHSATLAGESFNNHDEDIVMMGGDDEDDNHPVSISPPDSPAAPMAPPMETPEARRTGKKPVTIEKVVESVAEKAAEKVAEAKPRPVQKMRPTRGRGGSKAATSRRSQGGSVIGSTSSRSNSHEAESVAAPPPRVRGIGTATRSRPFRRGGGMVKSVSSNEGNDTGEAIFTPMVAKASSKPDVSSGFVAVNTPHPPLGAGPSNWLDDYENLPLSSFPAGGGNPRPAGSPALPPPRGQTVASPGTQKRNPKRLQPQQDLPEEPVLFSSKDIRVIYGGGNPGSIIANVTQEGQQNAVVEYASYICLSPDAHFDPPGTMCDNAEMLDIDGQEDPLDSDTIYPVWRKIGKMWMYCGDYTQGARRMVPVQTWKNSSEIVRKFWAKKVQDTEWGREFLVRKGFRDHGEIKNNSVQEVLGYFALADNKKGLRLSATTLNFKTFNRSAYDLMVDKANMLNPAGLLLAPISTLKPNSLSVNSRISLLATGSASPEATKTVSPLRKRKRRRIEEEEEGNSKTPVVSQRRPVVGRSERGRRASRNNVNYHIASLSESEGELQRTNGKGKGEVIELSEGDDVQGEEEEGGEGEGEEEEEEEEESEGEGEMVID